MNTLAEDNAVHGGYSDVYDWRPSVEKTDVMRTMEAIEGTRFYVQKNYVQTLRKESINIFVL